MQYLTLTVESCLRHFGVDGENLDRLTREHWRWALEQSGYAAAEPLLPHAGASP